MTEFNRAKSTGRTIDSLRQRLVKGIQSPDLNLPLMTFDVSGAKRNLNQLTNTLNFGESFVGIRRKIEQEKTATTPMRFK